MCAFAYSQCLRGVIHTAVVGDDGKTTDSICAFLISET